MVAKSVTRLAKWIKAGYPNKGEKSRLAMKKDAWPGREGDAGGFEFVGPVVGSASSHKKQKALPFSTEFPEPRSTENAQYMVEDTFQTCISAFSDFARRLFGACNVVLVKEKKFLLR